MNKMAAPDELAVNTSSPEKGGRRGSKKKKQNSRTSLLSPDLKHLHRTHRGSNGSVDVDACFCPRVTLKK